MKKYLLVFLCILYSGILGQNNKSDSNKIAGFRASRILQSYPNNQFPVPNYWANAGHFISPIIVPFLLNSFINTFPL